MIRSMTYGAFSLAQRSHLEIRRLFYFSLKQKRTRKRLSLRFENEKGRTKERELQEDIFLLVFTRARTPLFSSIPPLPQPHRRPHPPPSIAALRRGHHRHQPQPSPASPRRAARSLPRPPPLIPASPRPLFHGLVSVPHARPRAPPLLPRPRLTGRVRRRRPKTSGRRPPSSPLSRFPTTSPR